jgi:hypothetical protein
MKRTNILWITALLLGCFFDFLFWKQSPGLNFSIYVVLCLAGGFLVLELNGIKPAWKSLLLLIPILFFAAITFIRQEPLSLFLSFVLTLGLMGLLAASFAGGAWPAYGLLDYAINGARLIGSLLARPLIFLSESRKSALAASAEPAGKVSRAGQNLGQKLGWKRFWAVLRGVLIALPILAVFAALLASADLVFAQRLQDFTRIFRLENLPQYIFRAVYILIGAYALAGVFLHAARKSRLEHLQGQKPLVPQFLGFTEAAVVLGAVVALFAIFVVIQFRYFFGAGANIGLQGYTYSEYARRGFGELVAVAFCSLLLFLGLSTIVRRQTAGQRWAFSGLGIGMLALVGVILVSAFQRLRLYEAAYGFSRLRVYTYIFMIWLGLLLAVVVVLDLLRRQRLFPLAALLVMISFAATLALVNVDASIVRQNVARASQGQGLDVPYLASLSPDSVPALAAAYEFKVLPGLTRDAVGAVLVCRLHAVSQSSGGNWRSFTLSGWWADQAVARLQTRLELYQVTRDQGGLKVLTPGSVYYECP